MKKYRVSLQVTDKKGGLTLCVFNVYGETYAESYAKAIEESYSRYPQDKFTGHSCSVVPIED